MEQYYQLLSLFPKIAVLVVLVLCFFDKIKLAAFVSIIALGFYPLAIGYIYQFTLQSNETDIIISPIIPYSIAAILAAMAVIAIIPRFLTTLSVNNSIPKWSRWLFLIISILVICIGMSITLMFWYTPHSFGLAYPSALKGVISYVASILLSAILMLHASRSNSPKRPNLMRKIIIVIVMFGISQITMFLSLILIYNFPSEIVKSYPFEGSLIYVASLIWGVLLLTISKSTKENLKITS